MSKNPVYEAEAAALPYGITFLDLDHVVDYVEKILNSQWWQEAYPGIDWVWVHQAKKSKKFAWTKKRNIHFPPDMMKQFYVLHELAHVCDWDDNEERIHHGLSFREHHVFLVRNECGDWLADNLVKWYERYDVPITGTCTTG